MTCKVKGPRISAKQEQQEREEEKDTAAAAKWRTEAQGRRNDVYVSSVQIHPPRRTGTESAVYALIREAGALLARLPRETVRLCVIDPF